MLSGERQQKPQKKQDTPPHAGIGKPNTRAPDMHRMSKTESSPATCATCVVEKAVDERINKTMRRGGGGGLLVEAAKANRSNVARHPFPAQMGIGHNCIGLL